ncbi:hypothetical protein MA16_Dca017640 [Dendrobium catenatum]|uniref:Reverse transcriptase zinc-binding domain-containing protein n=1 Tax=Dendrobium catenatum TaxID=906689 RepID=A0A2I0VMR5_9ASPA|nr:hypothetical protein MA16_Dca017640 [Dendrobium catenatum]
MKDSVTLAVKNNSNLSFFWDPWCSKKSLAELSCPLSFSSLKLSDVFALDNWILPAGLPADIASQILLVNFSSMPNTINWDGVVSPSRFIFSKSYFSFMDDVNWAKFVWTKGYALRYACYVWMALQSKLKTADQLIFRGISVSAACSFCASNRESHSHLFFECDFSFNIITALFPVMKSFYLRPNLLQVYDFLSSIRDFNKIDVQFCFLVISILVYWIWRERNGRKFSSLRRNNIELLRVIIHAIRAKVINWKHYDRLKDKFKEILD